MRKKLHWSTKASPRGPLCFLKVLRRGAKEQINISRLSEDHFTRISSHTANHIRSALFQAEATVLHIWNSLSSIDTTSVFQVGSLEFSVFQLLFEEPRCQVCEWFSRIVVDRRPQIYCTSGSGATIFPMDISFSRMVETWTHFFPIRSHPLKDITNVGSYEWRFGISFYDNCNGSLYDLEAKQTCHLYNDYVLLSGRWYSRSDSHPRLTSRGKLFRFLLQRTVSYIKSEVTGVRKALSY